VSVKTFFFILIVFITGVAGYIAGRYHSPGEVITRHVEGPTVTGSAELPRREPELLKVGDLRVARVVYVHDTVRRTDTIQQVEMVWKTDTVHVIDTVASYRATVEDWNEERRYERTLFDDLNGRLEVSAAVRFNTLTRLDYAFTPIRTETTITRERGITPFAGVSFGVSGTAVGGGVFYRDVGVGVSYVINKGTNFHLLYTF
jgi:hypothetical protein